MTGYVIAAIALAAFGLLVRFALKKEVEIESQKKVIDDQRKAKDAYEREREVKDLVENTSFDDVLSFNDRLYHRDRSD